jgi:hypothetical protein
MELFGISFKRSQKNKNNPSASEFDNTVNSELENIVDKYAATSLKDHIDNDNMSNKYVEPQCITNKLDDITCIPINSNKIARLRQYNVMARFTEVNWAVDEIAMDFFHQDENKKIINLYVNSSKFLDDKKIKILQDEFNYIIKLFNFDENRYSIIRNFIIEGENAWENVINADEPEKGIRALKYISTKYYDFIKDRKTGEIIGIYFDKDIINQDIVNGILSNSYAGAANIFNAMITVPGYTYGMGMTENKIPLYWPQITYFNSGTYNYENTIVFPLIENASAPYQQLSLLQDAAVILRVTRAPERLVFNIDTGGLPEKKAKSMVSSFINAFKSKKASNSKGEIRNTYDPATMLDAYFFWKQSGSDGSSVTTLNSTASYDQMNDIDYFLRRILKAFKIPYTRYKEEGTAVQRKETITYEEYSFTKYIIRQQIAFAGAIKKTFITHLKLRKIWNEYNLNENLFDVEFVKPSLYELYQAQQLASLKMTIYKEAVEDEVFSKRLAMQKYLGYTKEMADSNFEERRKELLYDAATKYFVSELEKNGPHDQIPPIKVKTSGAASTGGGETAPSSETPPSTNEEPGTTPPEGEELSTPPTGEETPSEETGIVPSEEIAAGHEEEYTPPEGEETTPNIPKEEEIIPSATITTAEIPEETPGINLLSKEEYSEKPVKKRTSTLTFKDIFSKLNR